MFAHHSILATAILFLSIIFSVDALPTESSALKLLEKRYKKTANLSKYQVPLSNGTASLPAPTAGLTLKAITLGRGTQNYTCAAGSTDAPKAIGAVADLLDATTLLPYLPPSAGLAVVNILTKYVVSFDVSILAKSTIPVLGKHIFDEFGVPTFDLGDKGLLKAKLLAKIAAPKGAVKGPKNKGEGAVDWLALTDAPGSVGLKAVYRVETAGGKAPASCGGGEERVIEVQYAAQYWFYG
ncbi:MAG: hypothetical protein Q9183_003275 [Haloplaca sp. 2 TL-2023]